MIAAIGQEVLAYRRPLEGEFGRGVRAGVGEALDRFVDSIEGRDDRRARDRQDLYVAVGRGEHRAGRSLDALLAAYRVGARVMWRRFAAAGSEAGLGPEVLHPLAEALFAYVDELSSESADGYAEAQTAAADERARQRQRLIDLLARTLSPDPEVLHEHAALAGWAVPALLAPIVSADAPSPASVQPRLPEGAIAGTVAGHLVALVADPAAPGRAAEVARALRDAPAVRGPTTAPAHLAASLERALLGSRLQARGILPPGLIDADAHLPDLVLHADGRCATALAERALAALDGLPPATRSRLTATLEAWLEHQGRARESAAALNVHVQTIRYRVRQLEALLAERLTTADGRLELQLALRVRRSTATGAEDPA